MSRCIGRLQSSSATRDYPKWASEPIDTLRLAGFQPISSGLWLSLAGIWGGNVPITADAAETRAIAIAGMSYAYALAGMLKRTGVLDPEAIENTFEVALSSVENSLPPDDRSTAIARQLLDLMAVHMAAQVKPVKPTLDRSSARGPIRMRADTGASVAPTRISSR